MGNSNLKKITGRTLIFNLQQAETYEGRVTGNNHSCDKIQVPHGWKGSRVLVVLIK
jgi:putative transposon-encoded protein